MLEKEQGEREISSDATYAHAKTCITFSER
jgi:hypothetical protein